MQAASAAALTFYIPGTCLLTLNGILMNKITTPCSRVSLRIHGATTSDAACMFALHESGKKTELQTPVLKTLILLHQAN
jgi:hypothetical protein